MSLFSLTKPERDYCLSLLRMLQTNLKNQPKFPALIELQTVNRCNARCPMCPYASTTALEQLTAMSNELFDKIVSEAAAQPSFKKLVLSFQNEPLFDRTLIEKVKRFRSIAPDKQVEIVTNGSLIFANNLENLYSYFDLINISVNANTSETYSKVMGGLQFSRIEEVLNLISKKKEYVDKTILRFIRQQSNISEFVMFKKKYNDLGFRVFSFDINSRLGSVDNFKEMQVKNTLNRSIQLFSLQILSKILVRNCPIPYISFYIRSNGDVVLCFNDWTKNHILGNVTNSSIAEVFNSKTYLEIRSRTKSGLLPHEAVCNNCDLYRDGIWLTI